MNARECNDQKLDAPEQFRAALARAQSHAPVVPPDVDAAVLRAAREHLRQPILTQSRTASLGGHSFWEDLWAGIGLALVGRRMAMGVAGMATIVAAGVLVWLAVQPGTAARPEDLNADGRVDMLDAFALARELQQDRTPGPQIDLNRDGMVDERDVEMLAARAVRLDPRRNS